METRLLNISKAIAQVSIDAYNSRATFIYNTDGSVEKKVYNEIVIGVRCKATPWRLAKLLATVAILAYQQNKDPFRSKDPALTNPNLFNRAHMAAHQVLKKMIRQTNYDRKLDRALSM